MESSEDFPSPPPLTREQAQAWAERWRKTNERIEQLQRQSDIETRYLQTMTLLRLAKDMGWDKKMREEDDKVRETWKRLRAKLGGKTKEN